MSKKQHNYYYSFTSPPSQPDSSSSTPSAPPVEDSNNTTAMSPPGYDEAISMTPTLYPQDIPEQPRPPAKKSDISGHLPDQSIPSFDTSPTASSSSAPADGSLPVVINVDEPQTTYSPDASAIFSTTGDNDVHEPLLSLEPPDHTESFQGRPPPPNYSLYRAHYETKTSGILSRDRHLNQDGEALAQFLQEQNSPPSIKIKFHGYHEETIYKSRSVREEDGTWREERDPETKRVSDFNFDMDCSDLVSSQCQGLYVLPDPKTGVTKTVRELCDDYIHEVNALKELRLTKEIRWNYAELTRAFTAAIRAHGYYHSVDISYELYNYKITIKTDSPISKMSDHKVIRFLFFITFLWIFAWPLLWLFKKKFGHSTLKSEWLMKVSERQWYNDHVHEVLGQIGPTARFANVPFIL